ncbi:callose synthase 7 isoform X2 [Elaeis guineensis]|uniref:callose synthase 7 isoform X2 n=1 Tax=Elaeis guineensis var. tenera TaxID=51953 RepID=UPI000579C855
MLGRFHAFEEAHNLDPTSNGRGVRQFKTYLLHRLQKEEEEIERRLARNDLKEIQLFYQWYYDTYVKEGPERTRQEMAKHYQIASVLYDVLKTVARGKVDDEIHKRAKEVERKKAHFVPYNILPLYFSGPPPAIMELAEIKAAIDGLGKVENLPRPRVRSASNAQRVDGSSMRMLYTSQMSRT